jgi:small multidrug resistance pump
MAGAIVAEVCSTVALKASDGFAHPVLGAVALCGFGLTLWLLSAALRTLPISVAYAVWIGAGSAVVTVAGVVLFGERLSAGAVAGIGLVVAGVVVVNIGAGGDGPGGRPMTAERRPASGPGRPA